MKTIASIVVGIVIGFLLCYFLYTSPRDLTTKFSRKDRDVVLGVYPWLAESYGGTVKNMGLFVSKKEDHAIVFSKQSSYPLFIFDTENGKIEKIDVLSSGGSVFSIKLNLEDGFEKFLYSKTEDKSTYYFIDNQSDGIFESMVKNGKEIFELKGPEWVLSEKSRK